MLLLKFNRLPGSIFIRKVFEEVSRNLGWKRRQFFSSRENDRKNRRYVNLSVSRELSDGSVLTIKFRPISAKHKKRHRELSYSPSLVLPGNIPASELTREAKRAVNKFVEVLHRQIDVGKIPENFQGLRKIKPKIRKKRAYPKRPELVPSTGLDSEQHRY